MLLKKLFSALFGVVEEVAQEAVKTVTATFNGITMSREEAQKIGRDKMVAFASAHHEPLDPNSIDDRVKVLQKHARFDGTVDQIKQNLADELANAGVAVLQNYKTGAGSGKQNDLLVQEVDVMVGYGDVALRERR